MTRQQDFRVVIFYRPPRGAKGTARLRVASELPAQHMRAGRRAMFKLSTSAPASSAARAAARSSSCTAETSAAFSSLPIPLQVQLAHGKKEHLRAAAASVRPVHARQLARRCSSAPCSGCGRAAEAVKFGSRREWGPRCRRCWPEQALRVLWGVTPRSRRRGRCSARVCAFQGTLKRSAAALNTSACASMLCSAGA